MGVITNSPISVSSDKHLFAIASTMNSIFHPLIAYYTKLKPDDVP